MEAYGAYDFAMAKILKLIKRDSLREENLMKFKILCMQDAALEVQLT